MVNGYVTLDLASTNIYKESLGAIKAQKPIMVVDLPECYFADTITKSGTSIIITKGGKTITIANDNTITNVGDIQPLMENIVDSQGNKRFVEGEGTNSPNTINITYNKWSLSGSHLMLVIAGNIENGTSIASATHLMEYNNLPKYIIDKIIPSVNTLVLSTSIRCYGSDYSIQDMSSNLRKSVGGDLYLELGSITLTADRYFRVQIDLLIDADYSE